jgi:hypothetical protein
LQAGTWFCGQNRLFCLLDGMAGTTPKSAPALRHEARMSDDMP